MVWKKTFPLTARPEDLMPGDGKDDKCMPVIYFREINAVFDSLTTACFALLHLSKLSFGNIAAAFSSRNSCEFLPSKVFS